MIREIKKIIAVLLIVAMDWSGLSAVFGTYALLTSEATITDAFFEVGALKLDMATTTVDFVPAAIDAGAVSLFEITVRDGGSLAPEYGILVQDIFGNINACPYLELTVLRNNEPVYSGSLASFNLTNLSLAATTTENIASDNWNFQLKFSALAAQNITADPVCAFDFVFNAWQKDIASGNGFHFQQKIPVSIKLLTSSPKARVIYPNGGEYWYIVDPQCVDHEWCQNWCRVHGMNSQCQYEILWDARNPIGPDSDLLVNLWYSADSGQTWLPKFANNIPNTGSFLWKLPYDARYVSDKARIRLNATNSKYPALAVEDISDQDFCPPLLSIEDLMNQTFDLEDDIVGGNSIVEATSTQDIAFVPMTIEEINQDIHIINNPVVATSTEEVIQQPVLPIANLEPAPDDSQNATAEQPPLSDQPIAIPQPNNSTNGNIQNEDSSGGQ